MRWLILLTITLIAICFAAAVHADDDEDLRLARELLRRKWFKLAEEAAVRIVENPKKPTNIRNQAAELHVEIIMVWIKVGGPKAPARDVEALKKKYKQMFLGFWRGTTPLDRLEAAIKLARESETETDAKKRAEKKKEATDAFKKLGMEFEKYIAELRLEVAKFPRPNPPLVQWPEALRNAIWKRDLAEYLFAYSFLWYAKVVPEGNKIEVIQKGLKRFRELLDGKLEYTILQYVAELGTGQCYVELGQYDEAIEHFDYMLRAELPLGNETSEADIKRTVDVRLQAYYLEGYTYNLAKKHKEAEKILREMFNQSGKPVELDRPEVLEHWEKLGRKEVALMPSVQDTEYGRLAALQLAEALVAQARFLEGLEQAQRIFETEQEKSTEGKTSHLALSAAGTITTATRKYLETLPPAGERTGEQREQAGEVKVLLARALYAAGDYRAAAELYDELRRTVRCPKCGYEEVLEPQDFDKPPQACPKCKKEEVKLEKAFDSQFEVAEGAAKSYIAIFERLDNNDMKSLDRAQDIYQRLFKRFDAEKQKDRYWEVGYMVLKTFYYKSDYRRIVGEIDNLEELTEGDWRKMIPVERWRDRIRTLYDKARKALEEEK